MNTGCLPDRAPDYKDKSCCYWFDEMMMYNTKLDLPFPMREDYESQCIDFFDYHGDKFWIDLGEKVYAAYKDREITLAFIEFAQLQL